MSHKVLYRQYRPRVFDDVYGQRHITDVLKKQVMTDSVSHAYIFAGPRGTGKTSTAKILAMALNCTNSREGNPCLECDNCTESLNDRLVDIVEMDAASNNSVDNIREIREKVNLLPTSGKYKVYIIDEVHMLSPGAFNALLKTLEEPPSHAVFILATTEIRKVPKTILSRCQQFDFKRISEDEILARLRFVAGDTGIKYENEALGMIARAAEGALRDALSMLDMCLSYGDVTEKTVANVVGMPDSAKTSRLCAAIIGGDTERVVSVTEEMLDNGSECENVFRDVICCLGDSIMDVHNDSHVLNRTLYALKVISGASSVFRYATVPRIQLVTTLLEASLPECSVNSEDLALRVECLEKKVEKLTAGLLQADVQKTQTHEVKKSVTEIADEMSGDRPEGEDASVCVEDESIPGSNADDTANRNGGHLTDVVRTNFFDIG